MMAQRPVVLIAHGEAIARAGLSSILAGHGAWEVVADEGTDAQAQVLVTDYQRGLALARSPGNQAKVLVFTARDREVDVQAALDAGVQGYVLQSCEPEELTRAVEALARGARFVADKVAALAAPDIPQPSLTGRETEVLALLAEGCCNKRIALRLDIGVGTVKTHVKGIMRKLGATARTHAVVLAAQRGLVQPGAR